MREEDILLKYNLYRFIKNEDGQGLVELAFTLPVLLVILGAVLDFGWIYLNTYKVQNAAYSGARYVSMHYSSLDEGELERRVAKIVENNLYAGTVDEEVNVSIVNDKESDYVRVTVLAPVKCLTFVAQTFYGKYYTAMSRCIIPK